MPIEHKGKTYKAEDVSEPIESRKEESWGHRKVTQTIVGKPKGGRIKTDTYVSFYHDPTQNNHREHSQRLGPGKEITLTDGSKAKGT